MRESDLYYQIRRVLEGRGYISFVTAGVKGFKVEVEGKCHRGEFPILPKGLRRKPDLIGFKWGNEREIDAVAVECKGGEIREAVREGLGGALIYQKFFPHALVGTRHAKLDKDSGRVLEQYGLGWVTPDPGDTFSPSKSPLFDEEAFKEVALFGVLALTFREVIDAALNMGRYCNFDYYRIGLTSPNLNYKFPLMKEYRWICGYFEGVQYTALLDEEELKSYFSINIEHKEVLRHVKEKIEKNKKRFEELLSELGGFHFLLGRLDLKPPGPLMAVKFHKACNEVSIGDLLNYLKGLLKSKDEKPYVRIYTEIWKDEKLAREEYAKRMEEARKTLSHAYTFLSRKFLP